MPRLPSALGLGGAKRTGGLDWTLNPPMRSDSPNSVNHEVGEHDSLPCWVRRVRSRHAAMADLILM
eukprot:scaffold12670_cov119-Isochrysis_galbana.AAC.10